MHRRLFLAGAASSTLLRGAPGTIATLTSPGQINNPYGLRIGPGGALYICEIGNHRVSRLDLKTRKLSTVVGNQQEPYELVFDRAGRMLFVDMPAQIVRRWDPRTKTATTIAGNGTAGFSGDGGPATIAQLRTPHSIALDRDGRLLICDIGNNRVRRVDLRSGLIETYAGTGERKPTSDGAPLEGTPVNGPRAIDFDRDGRLFLALREGNAIYCVENGKFRHVAGTGEKGYTGDGGDARRARLSGPKGISCAADGSVYFADTENHAIRRVGLDGILTTVAGTGERGDGPDGDPLQCKLNRPHGVYAHSDGNVYIGDSESNHVRVIS